MTVSKESVVLYKTEQLEKRITEVERKREDSKY